MLLLLLSLFNHVQVCATPQTAAHQASPSLGFSRQEHWSGLPFLSPMHESEKLSCVRLQRTHGLQPTRCLRPCDFPGTSTGVGCHARGCLMTISLLGCAVPKLRTTFPVDYLIFIRLFLIVSSTRDTLSILCRPALVYHAPPFHTFVKRTPLIYMRQFKSIVSPWV